MKSRNLVGLAFLIGANWFNAFADDVKSLDFTIHQEYTSTRALGMGNAFTAVADDHSAIFYNPAALAFRKDGQVRMFLRGGTDTHAKDLFDEIDDLDNLPEAQQEAAAQNLLMSHYGEHFYVRAPTLGAVWVRPKWGIAFIPADLSVDMAIHRNVGATLHLNAYFDSTLAFSYSQKLKWLPKSHDLAYGITLKGVHRIYMGRVIFAPDLVEDSNVLDQNQAAEGLTGDVDIGTMWKPPVPKRGFFKFLQYMEPTFALVGRNLIDYGFKQNFHLVSDLDIEPPHLVRRFDFGSKWQLPHVWVFDPHFTADVRDMGHPNWSLKKGLHFGAEFYWTMFKWWKGHWSAGLNQGYWTAGFGAKLAWFQLDIASFGEEVGSSSVPQESRRYMMEMALDF